MKQSNQNVLICPNKGILKINSEFMKWETDELKKALKKSSDEGRVSNYDDKTILDSKVNHRNRQRRRHRKF